MFENEKLHSDMRKVPRGLRQIQKANSSPVKEDDHDVAMSGMSTDPSAEVPVYSVTGEFLGWRHETRREQLASNFNNGSQSGKGHGQSVKYNKLNR